MNEELQTAYNEWLLMFGFRVILINDIHAAGFMFQKISLYHAKMVIRKDPHRYEDITYKLKTPEELTHERTTTERL